MKTKVTAITAFAHGRLQAQPGDELEVTKGEADDLVAANLVTLGGGQKMDDAPQNKMEDLPPNKANDLLPHPDDGAISDRDPALAIQEATGRHPDDPAPEEEEHDDLVGGDASAKTHTSGKAKGRK